MPIGLGVGLSIQGGGQGAGRLPLTTAGWSLSFFPAQGTSTATNSPAGTLNLKGDGTNTAYADQQVTGLTVGRTYMLTFTATGYANGIFALGTSQGDGSIVSYIVLGTGTQTKTFTATASTIWVRFGNQGATQVTVNNIS